MIQEFPSSFFPTASGISDRVTRRTHLLQQLSNQKLQNTHTKGAITIEIQKKGADRQQNTIIPFT